MEETKWEIKNLSTGRVSYFPIGIASPDQKLKRSKPRSKIIFQGGLTVLISVLIIFTVVRAGTITPLPGPPTARFYTLSQIYNLIHDNNTTAVEASHSFAFSDTLIGTSHTLTEIYSALTGLVSAASVSLGTTYLGVAGTLVPSGGTATTANVLSGKTFFGDSQTNWTLQTGAMANNYFSLVASVSDQSVILGYYSGGTLAGDAALVSANIKSGISIFGVAGDANVVDTSSGDAAAGDVANNKVCFVDGSQITGSMFTNQKNQTKDDWIDSGGIFGEYTGEEAVWSTVSGSPFSIGDLGSYGLYSGAVKQDTRTGLWWSDIMSNGGVASTSSNVFTLLADGSRPTGGNTIGFCDALNTANFGGHNDWYLPTQKELQQAYIDGAANNLDRPGYYFWSSSELSWDSAYAWYVYLHNGYTNINTLVTSNYVRCVRR